MNIPIPAETPDPNIDKPTLPPSTPEPEPLPKQDPPLTDPYPVGDPPREEEPKKILSTFFALRLKGNV